MASFGAGGGSSTGSAGGLQQGRQMLQGLGLDNIQKLLGGGQQQGGAAVQPGQMAQTSPQQRLAQVMSLYSGGQ